MKKIISAVLAVILTFNTSGNLFAQQQPVAKAVNNITTAYKASVETKLKFVTAGHLSTRRAVRKMMLTPEVTKAFAEATGVGVVISGGSAYAASVGEKMLAKNAESILGWVLRRLGWGVTAVSGTITFILLLITMQTMMADSTVPGRIEEINKMIERAIEERDKPCLQKEGLEQKTCLAYKDALRFAEFSSEELIKSFGKSPAFERYFNNVYTTLRLEKEYPEFNLLKALESINITDVNFYKDANGEFSLDRYYATTAKIYRKHHQKISSLQLLVPEALRSEKVKEDMNNYLKNNYGNILLNY
jgi:hypothetical protein